MCVAAASILAAGSPASARGAPGDLDETYSGDGFVEVPATGEALAIAVQPDGGVAVLTRDGEGSGASYVVSRVLNNGDVDGTFAGDGFAEPPLTRAASQLEAQSNGSLLLAGSSGGQGAVARLQPDGLADPGFGADGVATIPDSSTVLSASADQQGRILALAYTGSSGMSVTRLAPDGSVDTGFGNGGFTAIDDSSAAGSIAVGPDGAIYVAMEKLSKLNPDGSVDTGFGSGGTAAIADLIGDDAISLGVLADGSIAVGLYGCSLISHVGSGCSEYWAHVSPSGATLGHHRGGEVAAVGESLYVAVNDAPRVAPAAIAVTRHRLDGSVDQTFGRGRAARYVGVLGGETGDLEVTHGGEVVALSTIRAVSYLGRLETTPGPADADADGLLDSADRCPLGAARNSTGCPRVPRELEIEVGRKDRIEVRVRAATRSCIARTPITLFRSRPGPDREIGAKVIYKFSRRAGFRSKRSGRFYARAEANYTRLARCREAKSPVLDFDSQR